MATVAGVEKLTDAQTIIVASRFKSVTVLVVAGTVTVSFTGTNCVGSNVSIPAGTSLTWAVDSAGENIECAATIVGVSGSSAIVTHTR